MTAHFCSVCGTQYALLPLSEAEVDGVVGSLDGLSYDVVYNAFWGREIKAGGQARVAASAERYRQALRGRHGE